MRLSVLLATTLALVSKVVAEEKADEAIEEHTDVEPETGYPDLTNFQLNYLIEEYADLSPSEIAEFSQGDTLTLKYTLLNEEDKSITIVGLGGSFRDSMTGEQTVNMTANSVEPLVIEPHKSGTVRQRVVLDFTPNEYVLAPEVFVAFSDSLKLIPARGQLLSLKEVPISMFNPQFLFLELIFFVILAVGGYYFYTTAVQNYFKKTAPISKGKDGKAFGAASGFDPDWIPKHHQALPKKSKARKAY